MLNVLIVDDEALVRTGIRYQIPWKDYQMQVVAEAGSVKDAMDIIQGNLRIDVVFTDIVMPVQNGLELLRWLRNHHPFITSVVLSHYNEFNYIQEALRLGITDYIIKTELNYPQCIQSLREIAAKALHNQKNRHDLKVAQAQRTYSYAVAIARLSQQELHVCSEDFAAAENYYPVNQNAWLLLYEHPLEEKHVLELEHRYKDQGILLIFERIDTNITDIILATKLFLSRDYFYECLPHLNVYALDAHSILHHSEGVTGSEFVRIEQELSSMQWIWNSGQMDELLDTIYQARLMPASVYNLFYRVQIQWKQFFPQNDIPSIFPLTGIHYWYQWLEWIDNFRTFTTTQSTLSAYAPEIVSAIQDLVVWIDDNFMINITLSDCARKTNLSTSYLSRVFKSITGRTLNQYVRDRKINYAKKMLIQSNLPIRRIAELCGFQDLFYFDKVFKKILGETPSCFRQNHKKGHF